MPTRSRTAILLLTGQVLIVTPGAAAKVAPRSSPTTRPSADQNLGQSVATVGDPELRECLKVGSRRRVRVTLKSPTELRDLVSWISSMTCKRLVVPAALQAQAVSFISPTPLTPEEAYRGFLSALEVMGLTVVPGGPFLKVVQSNWAVQSPVRTLADGERRLLGDSDEVVTQLVRLREVRVDQLSAVLQKLKSRAGDVSSFGPGNLLIITDHAANVRRMLKLVGELDVPVGGAQIWVVQPRHADPAELGKLLGEIFAPGGGSGGGPTPAVRESAEAPAGAPQQPAVRFLADPASGALIVIGSEPAFDRVRSLLKVLDVDGEASQPQAWVYRLKHGMADQLAGAIGTMAGQGGGRVAGKPGASPASSPFEGQVRVNAEVSSNSLLIMATPRDYLQVRRVVEELDRPRRQIFVEAYIMEVQLDHDLKVGVVAHVGAKPGDSSMLLGTSYGPGYNSVSPDPLQLTGLALGVQGPMTGVSKLLGVDLPSFGVVLQALQADSNFHLLSSPALLATENEEAEIQVGENIPVRSAATGSSAAQSQSGSQLSLLTALAPQVDRRNVGLGLKLTPTIGDGDRIRLKLRQEISAVADKDFGGLGASTSQRLITSVITLRDQQTVVIGGLITEEQTLTESKVPVLGDIPILGRLFRREGKKTNRKNLLLVLTPYIIRDDSDMRRLCRRKLEERQTFLRRYSQLRGLEPSVDIDFRHKRGLLAEINRTAAEAEAEARLAAEAGRQRTRPAVTPVP